MKFPCEQKAMQFSIVMLTVSTNESADKVRAATLSLEIIALDFQCEEMLKYTYVQQPSDVQLAGNTEGIDGASWRLWVA